MEESYAAHKLKRKRHLYRFYFFLLGIGLAFFFALISWLVIFHQKEMPLHDRVWWIIAFILAFLILLAISEFVLFCILNRKYRAFYQNLLKEEAMLEGLSIFDMRVDQKDISSLEKILGIELLKTSRSWTQTSPDAYFEIHNCSYFKHERCVILKTKLEVIVDGFIQLRNDSRKGLFEYQSTKVKQYGIGSSVEVKEYALYTTFGNDIYHVFHQDQVRMFYEFAKFVSCPVVITWVEDNLYIFLDGWRWNLNRDLRSRDSKWMIDAQIETLKTLQIYMEKMTNFTNKEDKSWENKLLR